MTYGWAILVVLIALGALFYLGVFSPKTINACTPVAPLTSCDIKFIEGGGGVISIVYPTGSMETDDVGPIVEILSVDFTLGGPEAGCDPANAKLVSGTAQPFVCAHALTSGDKYGGDALVKYQLLGGVEHNVRLGFTGTAE